MPHLRSSPRKIDFPLGEGRDTRAVVYVPSTTKDKEGKDVPVSRNDFNKRVKETSTFLSKTFGGVTRVTGIGSWVNKRGVLVKENVVKVESFSPTKTYKKVDVTLGNFVKQKAKEWKQDKVSFEFETPDSPASTLYLEGG